MKNRAFKVLVIIAFLMSLVIFLSGLLFPQVLAEHIGVMACSVIPIAVISAIQYIIYGQWSPFYMFKN